MSEPVATIRGVRCTKETLKALLVVDGAGFRAWVPKTQVHEDSEVFRQGHEGDLVITEWMAQKLGVELD